MPTNDDMKKLFSQRLTAIMQERDINQVELSKILAVSESTVGKWILCKAMPRMGIIQKLSDFFNVGKSYFLEESPPSTANTSINFQPKGVQIPVLGYVIAGVPISAVEDILGYEEISSSIAATGEFFCLKIKGDSMEPTFTEGNIIVVRQQPDVETNEIAVVLVNGDEGTVKRIKKEDHGIFLIGDNAMAFSPKFYSDKEIRELPVKIIGKVVELRRSF